LGKKPRAGLKNHSFLEGESERQGRSPQSIRRGANAAPRKRLPVAGAERRQIAPDAADKRICFASNRDMPNNRPEERRPTRIRTAGA